MVASAARAKAAPKDSRMKRAADSDHDGVPAKKLKGGGRGNIVSPGTAPYTSENARGASKGISCGSHELLIPGVRRFLFVAIRGIRHRATHKIVDRKQLQRCLYFFVKT